MKTEHENIYYDKNRKKYVVKVYSRLEKKSIVKRTETLDDAIALRDEVQRCISAGIAKLKKEELSSLFSSYVSSFLKEVQPNVKGSTYQKYKNTLKQIEKYLGHRKIKEITSDEIIKVISTLKGLKNDKISARVKHDKLLVIKRLYNFYNLDFPLEHYRMIKQRNKVIERRAFTRGEEIAFLKAAEDLPFILSFLFNMYFRTGCRLMELPALRWKDVNFEDKTITIAHSINKGVNPLDNEYGEFVGPTKNYKTRVIPVSDWAIESFRDIKLVQNGGEDDFVFLTPYNTNNKYPFFSSSSLQRFFAITRDKAGISKELTCHCIRHTFASRLITSGVDLNTVKELGGWSSVNILLEIYSHSNLSAKREAINRL